jgi:hypothetical protein
MLTKEHVREVLASTIENKEKDKKKLSVYKEACEFLQCNILTEEGLLKQYRKLGPRGTRC